MRKIVDIVLIAGFLAVDFFFFHDILKLGEVITMPQYITDALSIIVFIICTRSLLSHRGTTPAAL